MGSMLRRARPYAAVRSAVRRRPLGRRAGYYKEHSIATSRCPRTEWLIRGEHAARVLVASSSS